MTKNCGYRTTNSVRISFTSVRIGKSNCFVFITNDDNILRSIKCLRWNNCFSVRGRPRFRRPRKYRRTRLIERRRTRRSGFLIIRSRTETCVGSPGASKRAGPSVVVAAAAAAGDWLRVDIVDHCHFQRHPPACNFGGTGKRVTSVSVPVDYVPQTRHANA